MAKQSNNNTKYYTCNCCKRVVADDFFNGICGICAMQQTMKNKVMFIDSVQYPNADRQARQTKKKAINEVLPNIIDNFLIKALDQRGITVTDLDTVKELFGQILLYNTLTVEGR